MATLASAPETTASKSSVREITHWINGFPVRGASGRFGDVFHPATGTVQARVPLAYRRRSQRCRRSRRCSLPRMVRAAAAPPRPRPLPPPRHLRVPHGRDCRASQPRTRQGLLRRQRRSHARPRKHRVRHRHLRNFSKASSPSRSAPASTPGPCVSRSASSPASRPSTSPPWFRSGCSRSPSPAATPSSSSPSSATPPPPSSSPKCSKKPAFPTASSTSFTATRPRSTPSSRTPPSRPSPSSALPPSPSTSTPPAPSTASASRPSAARRTT